MSASEWAGRRLHFIGIGGELRTTGSNAGWGEGELIVVEADESDRSFLELTPQIGVITNVELDHHSTYRSTLEIEQAFADFAARCDQVIAWEKAPLRNGSLTTFGIESGALAARHVHLHGGGSRFEVDGVVVELGVPGLHNVLNALAALAACRAGEVPVEY